MKDKVKLNERYMDKDKIIPKIKLHNMKKGDDLDLNKYNSTSYNIQYIK